METSDADAGGDDVTGAFLCSTGTAAAFVVSGHGLAWIPPDQGWRAEQRPEPPRWRCVRTRLPPRNEFRGKSTAHIRKNWSNTESGGFVWRRQSVLRDGPQGSGRSDHEGIPAPFTGQRERLRQHGGLHRNLERFASDRDCFQALGFARNVKGGSASREIQ